MGTKTNYTLAVLLTLGTVPLYHFILTGRFSSESYWAKVAAPQPPPPAAEVRSPTTFTNCDDARVANVCAAIEAMRKGKARCVAGRIYRVEPTIIEPWPGGVRCSG